METGMALLLAFCAKRLVRFSVLSRYLGRPVVVAAAAELPEDTFRDLRWTFHVWHHRWFWPPVCLTEVLALRMMLDRRGLAGAIHLGVRRGAAGPVDAHAWMVCGTRILPRNQDVSSYAVLSIFQR